MANKGGTYSERYDGLQIKLESKMLRSGKCQVKFRTTGLVGDDYYGYALVEGGKTLREVISEIKRKLNRAQNLGYHYQRNLYSIKRDRVVDHDFVIFKT